MLKQLRNYQANDPPPFSQHGIAGYFSDKDSGQNPSACSGGVSGGAPERGGGALEGFLLPFLNCRPKRVGLCLFCTVYQHTKGAIQ